MYTCKWQRSDRYRHIPLLNHEMGLAGLFEYFYALAILAKYHH